MVTHIFMQNKNLKQIFIWPIILGVLSTIGLVVALLKDGVLEDASLLGLVAPILVIIYFYWFKSRA
jgi:hypothetical protein